MLWVTLALMVLPAVTAHNQLCQLYTAATENDFKKLVLVALSQNVPDFTPAELAPLIEEANTVASTCCSEAPQADCDGDLRDLFQRTLCSSESLTEGKELKPCCEKSGDERRQCFKANTARVLSLEPFEFSPQEKCPKHNKRIIGRLIYEVSRRHPEASQGVILRYAEAAEKALETCCGKEGQAECVKPAMAEADVEKAINDSLAGYNNICLYMARNGDIAFETDELVHYTQHVPQASFNQLHILSQRVTGIYSDCCKDEPGHHILPCLENGITTNFVNDICHNPKPDEINQQVVNCCNQTYSRRLPCMHDMKTDADFESQEINITIGPEICTLEAKDQLLSQKKLLYSLVRHKPTMTDAELLVIINNYKVMWCKCCAEDDKAGCFITETPKLISDTVEYLKTGGSSVSGLDKSAQPQCRFAFVHPPSATDNK